MTTPNQFMTSAKGLAKNPLGIIALFISLIYGFACLVLGLSSKNLLGNEKLPLIWFLVIFPVLVLIAFVYLVSYHHKKLYAPSDFRDDKSFLEASDSISKEDKIIKEYGEFASEITDNKAIKEENVKIKPIVSDRPRILEFDDFRSKYLQIENKALLYLEKKFGVPIHRNVRIRGLGYNSFDGIIETENEVIVVEIKYLRANRQESVRFIHLKKTYSDLINYSNSQRLDRKLKFLIFYVIEENGLFPIIDESAILREFEKSDVDVIIQSVSLKTLNEQM